MTGYICHSSDLCRFTEKIVSQSPGVIPDIMQEANHPNVTSHCKIMDEMSIQEDLAIASCNKSQRIAKMSVLAHLSQRLRMSYGDHLPSIVRRRPSVCQSTSLNFSSEIPRTIFFELHVWNLLLKGGGGGGVSGLKIWSNCHSQLIEMATMPIYDKTA